MHWWFSGKIGRCHVKSFKAPDDSASPGFDSRPMHPFAFATSCSFARDGA